MVNLYSDTQTRPTPEMRAAIAARRGRRRAAPRRPDGHRARGARRRAARPRGRGLPAVRDDVQRDRDPAARPPGRRRDPPRPRDPSAALRGAAAPAALSGAVHDGRRRRRRACSRRRRSTRRSARTPPATATPRARASCASSSRRTWAAAASGRSSRCEAVLDVARAHGLRTHLDGARLMNAVVASGVDAADVGRRLRQRLARLHQGPRRAGRRVPRRVGGAHRRGVAVEADARRRDAPGGDRRRRRPVRARPPRRPPRRRPRPRAAARRGSGRGCPASSSTPPTVETNILVFARPGRAGVLRGARRARTCW